MMKNTRLCPLLLSVSLLILISCTRSFEPEISDNTPSEWFEPEIAYPDIEGETVTINSVVFRKIDSLYIFGGDIVMTREQAENIATPATRGAVQSTQNFWWCGNYKLQFSSGFCLHQTRGGRCRNADVDRCYRIAVHT